MNSSLTKITTKKAAPPLGHYAQAMLCNEILYLSLQLGITPENPEAPPGDIINQTTQVLDNISEILLAGKSHLSLVLRATIYLSDIKHWDIVDKIYRQKFGNHTPARNVIPCSELHRGYDVGIEVTALQRSFEETKL